ncbi:GDP-mannose 4,6-dehydratase [Chloroflexota bacterium]
MKTVLVTGGAGFIGSHLIDRLLEAGHHIICLDNFDPYYDPQIKRGNIEHNLKNGSFELIERDIRDKEKSEEVFHTYSIDTIVHLAARAGVRASIENPALCQDVNIRGTLNLLELSKEYGIGNFIFGSSSSVYGINTKVPFSETDEVNMPVSPYAASKRAGELICYTYNHLYHIPVTCLRFFTVYGPRQRPEMAIHKFTRLIDQGRDIQQYGDGLSKRDYTYVSDIINGIMSAMDKKYNYEIINLGDSEPVELKYLVSLIEENLGKRAKIEKLPDQPGDVPITYADISKAGELLDYHPKVKTENGIELFVDWYRNQRGEE